MPNPLQPTEFVSPGDFLLDFVLGAELSRLNREKVALFDVPPKPGFSGFGEPPAERGDLGVVAGHPAPLRQAPPGSYLGPTTGPTVATHHDENPGAYLGYDRVAMQQHLGQRVTPTPAEAPREVFDPASIPGGVRPVGPAGPSLGDDAKPISPEIQETSMLDGYGLPLAIGAGVAGAGLLGGAGLAYYQHRKKKEQEAAALAAAAHAPGMEAEKLAGWFEDHLAQRYGINMGGSEPINFGQAPKNISTNQVLVGQRYQHPDLPRGGVVGAQKAIGFDPAGAIDDTTIAQNKHTLNLFRGEPIGPATVMGDQANFEGDPAHAFPAKETVHPRGVVETKAPAADGLPAGEERVEPSGLLHWAGQNKLPLALGAGALGVGGLAAYLATRKGDEEKKPTLAGHGHYRTSPGVFANHSLKLAAQLGPLEAMAAARATGYGFPAQAKQLAAQSYSDNRQPIMAAWARNHAGIAGGRQLSEGTKFVSPTVRHVSALLGDGGGDRADNIAELLGTYGDPRNVDKAQDAYFDNVDRYSDEMNGYRQPAESTFRDALAQGGEPGLEQAVQARNEDTVRRQGQLDHALSVTPRTVMNASDVVARDFDIAAHRFNRKEHPVHYFANPFVPGPLAEIRDRLRRRGSAEKADPDNAFRASLFVPGVPTIRGLLSPGNAGRREKARELATAAQERAAGPVALYKKEDVEKSEKKDDEKKEAGFAAVVKSAGVGDWLNENVGQPVVNAANKGLDYVGNRLGTAHGTAAANAGQGEFLKNNPWLPGLGVGAAAGAGLTALGGIGSKRKQKDRFGDIAVGGLLGAGVGGLAGGLWGSNLFGGGTKPPPETPAPDTITTNNGPNGKPPAAAPSGDRGVHSPEEVVAGGPKVPATPNTFNAAVNDRDGGVNVNLPGVGTTNLPVPLVANGSAQATVDQFRNNAEGLRRIRDVVVPTEDVSRATHDAAVNAGNAGDASRLRSAWNAYQAAAKGGDREGLRTAFRNVMDTTGAVRGRLAGDRNEAVASVLGGPLALTGGPMGQFDRIDPLHAPQEAGAQTARGLAPLLERAKNEYAKSPDAPLGIGPDNTADFHRSSGFGRAAGATAAVAGTRLGANAIRSATGAPKGTGLFGRAVAGVVGSKPIRSLNPISPLNWGLGSLYALGHSAGRTAAPTSVAEDLSGRVGDTAAAGWQGVRRLNPVDAIDRLRPALVDKVKGLADRVGIHQSTPEEAQAAVDRELSTRANRESEGRVADMYRRGVMPNPPPGAMTFDQFVETFPPMQRAQQSGAMQSLYLQYLQQQRGGR